MAKQTAQDRKEIVETREKGLVPGEGTLAEPQPSRDAPLPPVARPEQPTESEVEQADAKLPIYDAEAALPGDEKLPDTPSGWALKQVGNLDGEDVAPEHYHLANVHGEAYQAEKRKMRWGI